MSRIGEKIKVLAIVVSCLEVFGCIIFGVIIFNKIAPKDSYLGIIFAIAGTLVSVVSFFILYGFGELLENSRAIKEALTKKAEDGNKAEIGKIESKF